MSDERAAELKADNFRMSAYYYRFDRTGERSVDIVLSAVACAGKAFHGTEYWTDTCNPYESVHRGKTAASWIQNAAIDCASEMSALRAENERLRAESASLKEANEIDLGEKAPLIFENTELRAHITALEEVVRAADRMRTDIPHECPGCGERHATGHEDSCACDACPIVINYDSKRAALGDIK